MKNSILIVLATILLFACKHELERPTWDVDMIIPIANTRLNISNIIADTDTIFNEDEEGFISLVYKEKLLNINYDSLLLLETESEEKTIRIDSVNFDDVVIEHTITIESIIDERPILAFLLPDGSQSDIPNIPGIIQNESIPIDASEYFETMTLYNGMLNLELSNGFPTAISNVSIALYNSNNGNIISTFSTPLISSGSTYTESISVAGETLDYLMIGLINNIDINESYGEVNIDYSDAITTKISITDIQIMEATAYFPNQLLYEDYHEETFDVGTARLTEIGIKEGSVIINVLSTLPDTGTIVYEIPSLKTPSGEIFAKNYKIPPNISGEPTRFIENFDGYIMDLTGKEGRQGGDTVNTIYAILKAYLDSTGELETIHQVDSFYLFNEYSFTPEYARGYIGQDTLESEPEIIETDLFDLIESGSIDLEDANVSIGINNYIGADAAVQINLSASNDETDRTASLDNTEIYNIERASIAGGNSPTPSYTEININANEILEIFPNKIITSANFYLNPNGQSVIEGFLFPEFPIEANLEVEIPLRFIANELTLRDSSEIDIENIEEIETLYISIKNGLPLQAKVSLITIDDANQMVDTLLFNNIILAAIANNEGIVAESSLSNLEINNIDFTNIKSINTIASFTTQPLNEHISIYSTSSIDIMLSAKFKKKLGK